MRSINLLVIFTTININMNLSSISAENRTYYKGFDVLKFGLAILIVAAHTRLFEEFPIFHYYFGIFCSCAIPTFFAVSSFLFMKRLSLANNKADAKRVLLKTVKRLLCIFGIWYLIMLPMSYARFWETATLKESIYALLFSCSFNGYWFFKALIINTIILYFSRKDKALACLSIFSLLVYLFWAYNYHYHYIKWSISPYYSFYYHVFPFCLGALYAKKQWMLKFSVPVLITLFIACVILASIKELNPVGRILYPVILLPLFSRLRFEYIATETCRKFRQWSILFYVMQFVLIWMCDIAVSNYLTDYDALRFFDFSIVRFGLVTMLLFIFSRIFLYFEETKNISYLKYIH